MNQRRSIIALVAIVALVCGCAVYWLLSSRMPDLSGAVQETTPPHISPDYSGIVVPPAIAPLNFKIDEPGTGYAVVIRGPRGKPLTLATRKPAVRLPPAAWRTLLAANQGQAIAVDIYGRSFAGTWKRFPSIVDTVSNDRLDRFLVYRLLPPLYTTYGKMGIYQRDLSSFEEKPLWLNRMSDDNCMNCHTFNRNDPDYFVAHMRGGPGNGTLISQGRNTFKVNTATDFNRPAGYPAWHPSGNSIAFSVNTIRQFFHATGGNREGCDMGSKIVLYHIRSNTISSPPSLSDPAEMLTQPEWAPDGSCLYYCSAPQFPIDSIFRCHADIFYDLFRIRYDPVQDTWGCPEMVLSHRTTGQSISFPRISPDGKFMLLCMSAHGTFPAFRPGGDLYLFDLRTRHYRKLDVNSAEPESFPRWSSNGRWFVFVSKRIDGICARPYFSHIDTNGVASKPFLLPQKDPCFCQSSLKTYNLPELISKPFSLSPRKLVRAFSDNAHCRRAQLSPELRDRLEPSRKAAAPDSVSAGSWNALPRDKSANH
jgi:hypothetical protein